MSVYSGGGDHDPDYSWGVLMLGVSGNVPVTLPLPPCCCSKVWATSLHGKVKVIGSRTYQDSPVVGTRKGRSPV